MHVLTPQAGLPDMVYAANGAFAVDGAVYGARFRYPQRTAEAAAHRAFYQRGTAGGSSRRAQINEGEGDFAYLPEAHGGLVLAGHGFRTEPAAHAEAQEALGRPVVSLRLVDPRFYHLDVALAALDDGNIAYYPGAFSAGSQRVLRPALPGRGARRRGRRARLRSELGQRRPATWCSTARRPAWPASSRRRVRPRCRSSSPS